jgi:hypothetical protein
VKSLLSVVLKEGSEHVIALFFGGRWKAEKELEEDASDWGTAVVPVKDTN